MKIRVGIVGYGNLGKAVEREVLKNKKLKLVAIFSKRNVVPLSSTAIEPFDNFILYKKKIDVMLLCGSSKADICHQAPLIAEHFSSINTFDTHAKIKELYTQLNSISLKNGTCSIISCGWDPGIFSIVRGLFLAISKQTPYTFWGKGISLGHSDAIRNIDGVLDGVQITVPNPEAVRLAKEGKDISNLPHHFRECYIHTARKPETITKQIKNIPNYFKGQPTTINFVSGLNVLKLKTKQNHKGQVFSAFETNKFKNKMEFFVSMQSNPDFTARIMVTYISALQNLKNDNKCGAFSPLDIPISYLFEGFDIENLLSLIC